MENTTSHNTNDKTIRLKKRQIFSTTTNLSLMTKSYICTSDTTATPTTFICTSPLPTRLQIWKR